MLGLLFCGACFAMVAFYFWNRSQTVPGDRLDKQQWVVLLGAWLAAIGWIVTSYTAIRNSVKQHTVNTLLQSRLSATYMERADKVNKAFHAWEKANPLAIRGPYADPTADMDDEAQEALRYVLNYFEYIAIGIRHGDLHESMLQASLRTILTKTTHYSRFWIEARIEGTATMPPNRAVFKNLRWVYRRWRDPAKAPGNDLCPHSMVHD